MFMPLNQLSDFIELKDEFFPLLQPKELQTFRLYYYLESRGCIINTYQDKYPNTDVEVIYIMGLTEDSIIDNYLRLHDDFGGNGKEYKITDPISLYNQLWERYYFKDIK